ncbi:HYM1 [Candida oxycetoniae]|uniref:HYM1 n=1 Tax=Candida oxycetoniae TaxID=497107 RepID=A0AAI9WWU8_9ASCO|nr:HYM1 [Candida oxycetoniae]KAI3403626.2 HYM1 [Candida oxycetoniae]
MAFLFKRNPKTPQELVRALNDQLTKLDYKDTDATSFKKYQDEASRHLKQIKSIIYGDDENEPQPDQVNYILHEILSTNGLYLLTFNLAKLDFDSRKDVVKLFSVLLRRNGVANGTSTGAGTSAGASAGAGAGAGLSSPPPPSSSSLLPSSPPVVDYLLNKHPDILTCLIRGPETPECGLISGQILRDCIKFEAINKFVLYSPEFWNFFEYVQNRTFEVACDAMMTLNDLLTINKKLVSEFLANNYEVFMTHTNNLIKSNNYVTKRQSVKLLNDLVSQKANLAFLNKYFSDTKNLKYTMMLLSEKSKNLQLEGFHLLKFFIANPKRTQKVNDTLIKNKGNFIEFFKTFDTASFHDSSLNEERNYIIKEIGELPDKTSPC